MNKLLKDSILFVSGGFLIKSFGLILIPLYTRVLTIEEYGKLSLLNVIANMLSIIFGLGISNASLRYSFNRENEFSREKIYGNSIILQIASWPVVMVIVLPLFYIIFRNIYPYIEFYPLIIVLILSVSFLPIRHIWESSLRAQKNSKLFVSWAIILFTLQTSLIIFFVVFLKMKLFGIFLAQLIINFSFGIIAINYLKKYSTFKFSKTLSKRILKFGVPLIPYSIFFWLESASPRILLEKYASLRELGLFSVSMQFAGILKILTSHLDNALLPNFYELAGGENREVKIGIFQMKYFFFITSFAIGLYLITKPLLFIIVDQKFHEAIKYLPFLIITYWISDLIKIFKWNLLAANESGLISILQIISTILMIALSMLFLNIYNIFRSGREKKKP